MVDIAIEHLLTHWCSSCTLRLNYADDDDDEVDEDDAGDEDDSPTKALGR